jgi:hypothetical protein
MGGGYWDSDRYTSDKSSRAASKTPDFAYTATAAARTTVHPNLDPKRINSKPFGKLESRDNADHPQSNAVFVAFDVTGSNYERAVDAQAKLPNLMTLLGKYLPDPQVAVAANDDYKVEPTRCIQISDFESNNLVDEHIRNIVLVKNGGGNDGESYNLMLYAAARKTVLDCFDKRGRKGYFILYADEPIFSVEKHHVEKITPYVLASEVQAVFGDKIEGEIPIAEIIEELRRQYHVFVIWPEGGYAHARTQFVELFGDESVVTLQHPNLICECIASIVGLNEEKIDQDGAVRDLVAIGTGAAEAKDLAKSTALAVRAGNLAKSSGKLHGIAGGKSGAAERIA